MDIQKEREAFEVWFESNFESTKLHKFDNGVYLHERAQMSWEAWQAAKAQAVPEGFVVVPAQCPDPDFADMLFDELRKNAFGEFGNDLLIHLSDIDEEKIWDLMLEAAQEQAKAQAVQEWISTSDRMPKEGEEVFVHSLGQVRQVTRDSKWAGGFKERNCYGWQAAYSQSHWMPKSIELPEQYHFYYENDAKQKAMIEAQDE